MHFFVTSLFSSLLVTVSLKVLHLFDFISWHPVAFLKKYDWFDWSAFERWVILFLILAFCAALLLLIGQLFTKAPPFLLSFILGLAIAFMIEWQILNLPIEWASFKKLSIPFIIVVVTIMRLLIETSQFMRSQMFR